MAVRFVIGRAGTGKTHHCLTTIRQTLATSPVDGEPLVLLVPEQASLQMERALLSGELRATARAQVLSFQRLAYRVLQAAGVPERRALSTTARAMVLRRLVRDLSPQLRYYRRIDRLTGFLDHLGNSISSLIQEAITPEDLRGAVAGDGPQDDTDPQRAAKLTDLADIYQAYQAYLGDDRLDASAYLDLAREALPQCDYLRGAQIWVDGFAGFTQQEVLLLSELAQRATTVEVSLLVDPNYHRTIDNLDAIHGADLFAKPQRTFLALQQRFREAGLNIDNPIVLTPKPPPRFVAQNALAQLEANFDREVVADNADNASNTDVPAPAPSNVRIVKAPDRRTEVAFAVAAIGEWVRRSNGALRYRDVALIARDLEPYADLLTAELEARDIPYFIDRRRSVAHHPLVEFVRGALAVVAGGFSPDAMRPLLKTGLTGLDEETADALENYLLAHGIAGVEAWSGSDWTYRRKVRDTDDANARQQKQLTRVNAARMKILNTLEPLTVLVGDAHSGADWANALAAMLDQDGDGGSVADRIEAWAVVAEGDGQTDEANAHRQCIAEVVGLIEDLADALEATMLDAREVAEVVEAGLSALTLGLIPPTVDQVLVGSIERSRHPEIKAAVLLGMNDGVFPMTPSEDAVLSDEDRTFLAGRDIDVGATRRQRIFDEGLLGYVAATRPCERLLVTYPVTGSDGEGLRPSPFLDRYRQALPGLVIESLGEPVSSRATWPIATAGDLAAGLALEMRHRPSLGEDDPTKRRTWNDMYELGRQTDGCSAAMARSLSSLTYRNEALLSRTAVETLLQGTYTASVSELETFAACPFKRFANYGLRLEQRQEAKMLPTDVGTLHHAILEEFLNTCLERGQSLAEVEAGEVLDRLTQSVERLGAELQRAGSLASARDTYVLNRSPRALAPIIHHQQRIATAGHFRPNATEKKFGFTGDPNSLPALEIDTPLGRKAYIRGLIDRVDLADIGDELLGVVIDYKRTRDKRLSLGQVYHGLSLQLLGYLLALAERGETLAGRPITPVGAFYVSLLRRYRAVEHPSEVDEDEAPTEAAPRGLFDAGRFDLLQSEPVSGWSRFFKTYVKKDGTLGQMDKIDAAHPSQFAATLQHTRRKLGELADAVLDGDISVSPYRLNDFSPCGWCPYQAVCRFEFGDSGMRHLESLKRSEVFARLEASR